MTLIIGGAGQGKLAYALDKTGLGPEEVAHTPEEARTRRIFAHLEAWVRTVEDPDGPMTDLLVANPEVILLCDEVGCGVVPLDRDERAWRELVGRICCELAEQAAAVYRVCCGLGAQLK